ncbi:hypothetical protein [Streptomyces sp. CRN 30]|uniref:hypothetical protein n=1 Tax=Streptomyces sp. CRN 30 TaxID=3075613 RepID=UPI002A822406|nr:hypothetical protein [Streptomyces sp. CRN 30]
MFIDVLHRVDRPRRLIEYRRSLRRDRAIIRCAEHVRIADPLLAGERPRAARAMRRHLASVSVGKVHEEYSAQRHLHTRVIAGCGHSCRSGCPGVS